MKASFVALALAAAAAHPARLSTTAQTLAESRMYLEYDATNDEAVVVVEADSDSQLSTIAVRDPNGALAFKTAGSAFVSQARLECGKRPLAELRAAFAPGRYEIVGRTASGEVEHGLVVLQHTLPATPVILEPASSQIGVEAAKMVVSWLTDSSAESHRVVIEQDEKDGLTAIVPKGVTSLAVPSGIVEPGRRVRVEVAAIAGNGNVSIVEIECSTR
jgi:hypothetical protein